MTEDEVEVAIDVRRSGDVLLEELTGELLPVCYGDAEPSRNKAYAKSTDLVRALARVLDAEAREPAEAGAQLLQIDEPFLAGYPEEVVVAAINITISCSPRCSTRRWTSSSLSSAAGGTRTCG